MLELPWNHIHWILAAIFAVVPLFHLWLHALLPVWRKHPLAFYALGILAAAGSFWDTSFWHLRSEYLFEPTRTHAIIGGTIISLGLLSIISSIITLGPKRFFVWAVLRPNAVPAVRIAKGPFRFIPHPSYIGIIVASIGNLVARGQFYLLYLLIYLCLFMPIVILLEEEELRKRVGNN